MALSTAQAMLWSGGIAAGAAAASAFITYLVTSRSVNAQRDENRVQRRIDALKLTVLPARRSLAQWVSSWRDFKEVLEVYGAAGWEDTYKAAYMEAIEAYQRDGRRNRWTVGQLGRDDLRVLARAVVDAQLAEYDAYLRAWGPLLHPDRSDVAETLSLRGDQLRAWSAGQKPANDRTWQRLNAFNACADELLGAGTE